MTQSASDLAARYTAAAPKWSDKMRALGYFDGYLGFLADRAEVPAAGASVVDVGTGTGAFAEAWAALHEAPARMVLLDPSAAMLEVAHGALLRRGVVAEPRHTGLETAASDHFDIILAAHVIEHFDAPCTALSAMRRLARPGARLFLVVSKPHWCNVIIWLQWRHRTFRPDEITGLLQAAGFEVEARHRFPSGPPSRTSFALVARAV
ncbi:class I SAM-dependent methyltransferase [Roseobacter sinensis]|uniref:Class I SAM-dependent methyltransferase n=1 Tax=Roseobacter sinensis TaxID=2931391 RepID=A0ABT3BAP4_9RHOB|nr:class I SAM-dependent methyltransferase [Roseobacter sp. WL0113]MCV3270633.1 class I SAM-dependent methyltransferase [Roseobacter sp. WL0113]